MTDKQDKLSVGIKLGWAVGELPVATYIGLTVGFLLFYSTQALGISPWVAGIVLLVPRLWDAFSDPIMGAISDRTRTRMGRRRPYLFAGSILLGVSIIGLFSAPADAGEMAKAMHVFLFYLLASTAITIFDVPYSAMAAEMTQEYKERTNLTGYKMMAARIGILAVLFGSPFVFGSKDSLADGFRLVGYGFGIFMIVTGLATFFLTRNAPRYEKAVGKFDLRAELDAIRENRPFRALWTVFLFQNLAIGVSATMLLYLLTMVVHLEAEMIGGYMAIAAATATIATPAWVMLGRRISKKRGYYLAIVMSILAPLPVLFLEPNAYVLMFMILLFAGAGDAAGQLFPNAMVPDTVEIDELRSGERREGAIFGAWAFCRKLGMTGGAFLASLLLSAFGFVEGANASQQPDHAIDGVRYIYALLPVLLWFVSLFLLGRYKLDEAEFNRVKEQLARKGSA